MRTKLILCFKTADSSVKSRAPPPVASTAICSKAMVLLLFIVAPIVCGVFGLGSSFVVQYFVSFLVLQSYRSGRENWFLYFCGILNAMFLLSFSVSPSRCRGFVCSVIPIAFFLKKSVGIITSEILNDFQTGKVTDYNTKTRTMPSIMEATTINEPKTIESLP